MGKHVHDPRHLDVAAAAAAGTELSGQWPLAELHRLAEDGIGQGDQPVEWSAGFEQRRVSAGPPQVWLRVAAKTTVWRECQRCLQPVALELRVDRGLRFVATEEEAAELDADSEEDVLALSRRFDLLDLVEDELLLALPFVPLHGQCPAPGATQAGATGPDASGAADHPFAALAALRRGRQG